MSMWSTLWRFVEMSVEKLSKIHTKHCERQKYNTFPLTNHSLWSMVVAAKCWGGEFLKAKWKYRDCETFGTRMEVHLTAGNHHWEIHFFLCGNLYICVGLQLKPARKSRVWKLFVWARCAKQKCPQVYTLHKMRF